MPQFNSSRRKALKRMALLGAASLVPAIFPARAARTAVLTAGFVYIGPFAPKGYITGAEYNWTQLFETFIETLQKGGTLPNFVTGGYDKDYVRSNPFGAGATPEAINAAKTAMQAMRNGDAIFVGPISDNAGPAGTTYGPYADEVQQTNYLIEEAKKLLRDLLSHGEKLKSQIEAAAESRSISEMTLRRAAADLEIVKYKKDRRSYWALPHAQKSLG